MNIKGMILAIGILLTSTAVYSQTTIDTTKTKQLEEVFITANRSETKRSETPVAISKLNAKAIDETKATAMYEIVNKIPGVFMSNIGNEQHMMAIRQPISTSAYYLYLEDGLPIRPMGIFNHNALLEINQFNVESVEVVKGPVSSLYGPEAVGGAINLISAKPSYDPEFKFGVQADQWGYKRIQAAAGATIGKFGFHISGITSDQKNSWMTFSDYKKVNINARFDYKFNSKTRLISNTMFGKYYSDMSGSVNEDAFNNRTYTSTTDFTYRKSDALRTRLTLEHDWNALSSTSVTAYFRDNKLGQNPAYGIRWTSRSTTATGEINSSNFKSYGALAQHTQQFEFLQSKIVAGVLYDYSPSDYWSYRINLKANLNPGGLTVNNYQIIEERPDIKNANYTADIYNSAEFLQLSFKPFQNTIVTTGLRYDNMKVAYNNALDNGTGTKVYDKLTSKIGVNYNPFQVAGFYATISQGFAPPGVSAIFRTRPGTGGTTGVPANFYYNLEPATFVNYEVGGWLSILNNKLGIDYAFYYLDGKNELLSVRLADNSTDYRSAGATRHKGIEFGFNYKPTAELSFRFGGAVSEHTFIDFKVSEKPTDALQDLNGKEMPSGPRWVGNSELNYYPKWLPNFRTSLEYQLVGSYFQDQINTVKYGGYSIFNARFGYKWKSIELFTNVLNLTDKLYAYNVTRANTTTSQPTYTAAAPRTFLFGIQYNLSFKK
jgi:outer membrane receptor protein involved in Fe transport